MTLELACLALLYVTPLPAIPSHGMAPLPRGPLQSAATHAAHRIHALHGPRAGDQFGVALATAGDVNGDGVHDWILGAPATRVGQETVGRVIVVSGVNMTILHEWFGAPGSLRLGGAVAAAGDVDQDGHGDLLVGAPYGAAGHGEVRLYSGATGAVLKSWQGSAAGDQFGRCVSGTQDVDGDGIPDVLVGAPQADIGGPNAGELSLFSGSDGTLLRVHRGSTFDQLGFSTVGTGDLNGDGRGDYAVGVPFSDAAAFNGGAVMVFSGTDGALLYQVAGQVAGDQLGFGLSGGQELNGDGVLDLGVCAPGADANGFDSGAAYALSGLDGSLLRVFPGPGPGLYLSAVSLLGDVNGDGRGEVLAGCAGAQGAANEAGQVELFSGSDGSSLKLFLGPRALGWFGAAVAGGGDVNGDGIPDFLVGAPGHQDHQELLGFVEVLSPVALP